MKVSIEFTLLPLQNEFETPIQEFIKELRVSQFKVLENSLSTHIYGDYYKLMPYITELVATTFENLDQVVLNMKVVKTDRSNYEPDF